jgi:hypothetical protein
VNSLGESAENQVFRVRKPSVQKNKCFVCVYAGNKSSVNTPSGTFFGRHGPLKKKRNDKIFPLESRRLLELEIPYLQVFLAEACCIL